MRHLHLLSPFRRRWFVFLTIPLLLVSLTIIIFLPTARAEPVLDAPERLAPPGPQQSLSIQNTVTVTAGADTFVWSQWPNSAHGDEVTAWIYRNPRYNSYATTLLKFKHNLPPGTEVLTATLRMKIHQYSTAAGHHSKAYLLEPAPWEEDSVTWNTRPMEQSQVEFVTNTLKPYEPSTCTWDTWDVTELVRYAVLHQDAYTNTIPIGVDMVENSDHSQEWYTKEGHSPPELIVTYRQADTGVVRGYTWEDRNRNGQRETGEPGIPQVVVRLQKVGGQGVQEVHTDRNGFFQFTDVPPGTYTVTFVYTGGMYPTTQRVVRVDVEKGKVIDVNFGIYPLNRHIYLPTVMKN